MIGVAYVELLLSGECLSCIRRYLCWICQQLVSYTDWKRLSSFACMAFRKYYWYHCLARKVFSWTSVILHHTVFHMLNQKTLFKFLVRLSTMLSIHGLCKVAYPILLLPSVPQCVLHLTEWSDVENCTPMVQALISPSVPVGKLKL